MLDSPVIGISTSYLDGEQKLRRDYVLAVERAGGVPLPVPMVASRGAMRAFARLLHGVILTGGPAIETGLIGDLPDDISETDQVRVQADEWLLEAANDAGLPVLGICYGMQLLSAATGGTIFADVQRQRAGSRVHSEKRGGGDHPVRVERDSHLHRLLNATEIVTNTRHIQAIAEAGAGLRVVARAEDGVVEAIESEDGRIIGVQFHPERMGSAGDPLFQHLVSAAADRREQMAPATA